MKKWHFFLILIAGNAYGASLYSVEPAQPEAYSPIELILSKTYTTRPEVVEVDIEGKVIDISEPFPDTDEDLSYMGYSVYAFIDGLPAGEYSLNLRENGETSVYSLTISEAPPSIPVYVTYNAGSSHYFITADEAERSSIENGSAGNSWIPFAVAFQAWPAQGPAPAAAVPVCRFYSSRVNSHFYTANAEECAFLKDHDTGWTYEGIAFKALIPSAGSCPSGTEPVWRLYNNRAAEGDSNHHFLTKVDTYRSMMKGGRSGTRDAWIGEGIAFCSPKVSE